MGQRAGGVFAAACVLTLTAAAVGQTTIYETGFENPPFTAGGTLQGADAWLIQSTPQNPLFAIAQGAVTNGGTQAAEVQSDLATASSWAWKDVFFNPVTAGTPIVTVSWDMNISATGTVTQSGIDVYSATPFARLVAVGVNTTNVVNYLLPPGAAFVNTTGTITRGQWHKFKAVFDYTTNQLDLFLDGTQLANDLAFTPGSDFGDADLWKGGAGTAHTYYDNFKIVAAASVSCYPDCNGDGALTVQDFGCFQTKFVQGDPYADCNGDGQLTVQDFGCYQTKFVQGCP